jgi:hypothetical protein
VRADYVQGFRLCIRQRAIDALEANLPLHLFEAFLLPEIKRQGEQLLPLLRGNAHVPADRCQAAMRSVPAAQ